MKKLVVVLSAAALSVGAFAGPCGRGCGPCRPCGPGGWRPGPVPCHYYRPCPPPCHRDWWGRGGCNFWPGFIGGVVGGAVASSVVRSEPVIVTQPTVVTQPVVVSQPVVTQTVVSQPVTTTQNVWIEGRYVDAVQANGTVVRTWQPGHYEQRTVVVQ